MGVSRWIGIAKRDVKSYRHFVCEFCGAETLTGGAPALCSNCESVVGSEIKSMQGSNPELLSQIESLRTAVLRGDFDVAAAVYDQMMKDRQSPQLLYARGLMCIEHSNYVVSQIDYSGEGFMEQNAELKEKSAKLVSEGKKLIAKALSVSEMEMKEAPSAYGFYRMFLCALKINNLRAASAYLKEITKLDKAGTLASYAKIVLDTQGGLYGDAERELGRLAKAKSPPANAFYYATFVAFKRGDHSGARHLIRVAGGLIEEPKKGYILAAMGEAES